MHTFRGNTQSQKIDALIDHAMKSLIGSMNEPSKQKQGINNFRFNLLNSGLTQKDKKWNVRYNGLRMEMELNEWNELQPVFWTKYRIKTINEISRKCSE